jgi:hypothetical protein
MKCEARNWICVSIYGMHMYDAKDYETLFNILWTKTDKHMQSIDNYLSNGKVKKTFTHLVKD